MATDFQLRTYSFIDSLQPQLAAYVAKDNKVFDPAEYDAALYVEIQQIPWVLAITKGIATGVVGLFLSVVLNMGRSTVTDKRSLSLVIVAFVMMALFKMDPLLLIVLGGMAGAWFLRPAQKTLAEK